MSIDIDFEILGDLRAAYNEALDGRIDDLIPKTYSALEAERSKRGPMSDLMDQMDLAAQHSTRVPARIRVIEMVAPGMMLLAPYELDGSAPAPERTVNDSGPCEVLIHPDDLEKMMLETGFRGPWRHGDLQVWGIPVVDDTIEARRARDEAS